MKQAVRFLDYHVCPLSNGVVPHVGGEIIFVSNKSVYIEGNLAATVNDKCSCSGSIDTIITGSNSVFISNQAAVRVGDNTLHGGKLIKGANSVFIG